MRRNEVERKETILNISWKLGSVKFRFLKYNNYDNWGVLYYQNYDNYGNTRKMEIYMTNANDYLCTIGNSPMIVGYMSFE